MLLSFDAFAFLDELDEELCEFFQNFLISLILIDDVFFDIHSFLE